MVDGEISFPRVIDRNGSYIVRVPMRWSVVGSRVEDQGFLVGVNIFGLMRESPEVETRSGSRTFEFRFSGSEVDFGLAANTIVVTVAGGLMCDGGSSDGASASIAQPYYRKGGN
jgi:hypothetical protein